MRVTYVMSCPPPIIGGSQLGCLRLAQHLQALGHETRIAGRFTRNRPPLKGYFRSVEPAGEIEHEGVSVSTLSPNVMELALMAPVINLLWKSQAFSIAHRLYVRAMNRTMAAACAGSDIVHYMGGGAEMLGFSAGEVARRTGAAFCIDPAIHVGEWGDFPIDGQLYGRADMVFCYSTVEAHALLRLGVPNERIREIPCGFDYDETGDGEMFRQRHGLSGPVVLFLGRQTETKGVFRLLEAWPIIASQAPAAALVIAGPANGKGVSDTEWQEILNRTRKQARAAGGGFLLELEDLSEREKQDSLAACDVLCVPSTGESFGMVYYEAGAHGKPVVALDHPVLRTSIEAHETGLLAEKNPESIASSVLRILSDPRTAHRLGENGRRLARRHRWEVTVPAYLQAYDQILTTVQSRRTTGLAATDQVR